MNQYKTRYAVERLDEIHHEKTAALREALTKEAKTISMAERIRLIEAGKVKLINDIDRHTYLRDAYDFSAHETSGGLDRKALAKGTAAIDKRYSKAKDKIMLSDCTEEQAAKLISDFEAHV